MRGSMSFAVRETQWRQRRQPEIYHRSESKYLVLVDNLKVDPFVTRTRVSSTRLSTWHFLVHRPACAASGGCTFRNFQTYYS